jgi:hypothetical protein
MACSDFSAKRATKRQSPIAVSSSASKKSFATQSTATRTFGKVPTPAKCQNRKGAISLGRLIGKRRQVRRISASGRIVTILPSLSVSPRSPHPARPCAPSHPTPREPLSFRGERHIPGRRSAPDAADLYRDKVARCQTRSHGHRSISKGFQWKSIAAPVSRH